MQNTLNSICIVGGGSAGWMAATLLSSVLRGSNTKITLIESPDIATIGVGESTVPSIMDFIHACQIDLKEFIQATSASFKLGIRFDDWLSPGESFFHPFGKVGKNINGFEFYQAWLKSLADEKKSRWLDYSTSAIMAEQERFMLPPHQTQNWVLYSYAHALHLDAIKVAQYLRKICLKRGVLRIEATVKDVTVNNKGFIESVTIDNDTNIASDFFIDCTGFKSLLINKALKIKNENWSHLLPCDRAVTVQTKQNKKPVPYTIASAKESGWTWQIPLQHRTGNGYVFSSKFCTDQEAISTLINSVKGELLNEPNVIPFSTGKREKIWHNNCLALGLSSGFLEPLESTAIHLVYKTLVHFIEHFPDQDCDIDSQKLFNQKIDSDYYEVRDFIILHYCTSKRTDSDFWRCCQSMEIPDPLANKLRTFGKNGHIPHMTGQLFTPDSWYSVLEGMNLRPEKYHPLIAGFDRLDLSNTLTQNINAIRQTVSKMPDHHDYIQAHCPAS